MSRQKGICFAEVEFSTIKGIFRCHWSQHRSHKKIRGKLQQPKHEIADVRNDKILESRIHKVAEKVEKVTGMDFDRFTRSTLLAQGGFAAFLEASADMRAPLLEQITGTEIYSNLSIKVHELQTAEQTAGRSLSLNLCGEAIEWSGILVIGYWLVVGASASVWGRTDMCTLEKSRCSLFGRSIVRDTPFWHCVVRSLLKQP